MMRKVSDGVVALDGLRLYGISHAYIIGSSNFIHFQDGSIKENGVNGCQHEDLLAIIIDRLRDFQSGDYACEENAKALENTIEALRWLEFRTAGRIIRGVEGTNKK